MLKAKLNCYDGSRRVCRTRSDPVMTMTGLKRLSSLAHCFTSLIPTTMAGASMEMHAKGDKRVAEGKGRERREDGETDRSRRKWNMCVCVCVCMYIHMHACMHVCMYAYMYTHTHTHIERKMKQE